MIKIHIYQRDSTSPGLTGSDTAGSAERHSWSQSKTGKTIMIITYSVDVDKDTIY